MVEVQFGNSLDKQIKLVKHDKINVFIKTPTTNAKTILCGYWQGTPHTCPLRSEKSICLCTDIMPFLPPLLICMLLAGVKSSRSDSCWIWITNNKIDGCTLRHLYKRNPKKLVYLGVDKLNVYGYKHTPWSELAAFLNMDPKPVWKILNIYYSSNVSLNGIWHIYMYVDHCLFLYDLTYVSSIRVEKGECSSLLETGFADVMLPARTGNVGCGAA